MISLLVSLLCLVSAIAYDSDYNLDVAERYVEMCGVSYCTDPKLRNNCVDDWSCKACSNFPNMTAKSFKSSLNDGNGFVGYDGTANEIVVAFSGTDPLSIRNWIDDLNFFKTNYPYCDGCEVHEGFYNTYLSVQDSVKSLVSSYQSQYTGDYWPLTRCCDGSPLCRGVYTHGAENKHCVQLWHASRGE
mmetsp:Transcript_4564/g.9255  ORF Transcript_4564/g.9255 Transcript_4564/m.9255 type:complete len:188 (+) Transcript_4564:66-629(+)